jgi:hypothetical protein
MYLRQFCIETLVLTERWPICFSLHTTYTMWKCIAEVSVQDFFEYNKDVCKIFHRVDRTELHIIQWLVQETRYKTELIPNETGWLKQ